MVCLLLNKMGAKVVDIHLKHQQLQSHIELLDLDIISIVGDIRDLKN